ncbi:hypothetical protein IKD57_01140 [Candidatus Saccharibacteria bacterium]|nr:hypothetical protein [Candidatus Saccharibacteria bacterium]
MAKEIAIGKRAKISEAQQHMLLAVLGASVFLGVAISLISHFVNKISFNAKVIMTEDESIVAYSDTISQIGICTAPKGSVYTIDELKKCNPNTTSIASVPGTLRANIVEGLASNSALNSVPKESSTGCVNPDTKKNYTYKELSDMYNNAVTNEEIMSASGLLRRCSALRVIPDALPAFKNEEALLSSLNKIFIISNWEPEQLAPSGGSSASALGTNLNEISVSLMIEADTATTTGVLNNIERSIRNFNMRRASIEWSGENSLTLNAQANAYYMTPITITESSTTIKAGGDTKK